MYLLTICLKSTSDHEVCGLYRILCWILTHTKSHQHLAEFHKSLIADFHPDFYNTTSRYVKQIGSDRWQSFSTDQYEVVLMLDGKVTSSQTMNIKLKQTPIKSEPNRVKDEQSKSQNESAKVKNERVPTSYTPQQLPHTDRMPSLKAALTQSTSVKPEKTISKPQQQSRVESVKQEKTIPPKTGIPQVKPEKIVPRQPVPKETTPQVKAEKVAQASKSNHNQSNSKSSINSDRLNTSAMSSPSKPKIKPASARKVLTTPVQNNSPAVQQTPMKRPQILSQDEDSPTTKKRERKWRKEHNDKLMEYFSNRPQLANNSFFESDRLMQQFIESYEFIVPLTIPTLAKRKYKYDQFFNAIIQATQTIIKAEKTNTNKRKDPPSSSSTAKRYKL